MAENSFNWSSVLGASLQALGSGFANFQNKKIAQWNIQAQKDINAANLAYQQKEAEITRQREDNAVRRAMNDITAAGLSKTLASGNSASANYMNPYQAQAPTNNFKYESALEKLSLGNLMLQGQRLASDIAVNDARKQQMEMQLKKDQQVFNWYDSKNMPADGSVDKQLKNVLWIGDNFVNPLAKGFYDTVLAPYVNLAKKGYKYISDKISHH